MLDRLISPRAALRRATRLTQQGKLRRAFLLLSRAAQAGLAEAEYRVGRCYLEGGGVPPSRADGLRWLGRAAAHGYVEAQSLLAMLLIQGTAAPLAPTLEPGARPAAALFAANDSEGRPDFDAAVKWARLAAEGGSADGQAVLGYILTSGPEALRDLDAARRWYKSSAEAGCPQGSLGYALALAREAADASLNQEVFGWLQRAAQAGLPTALYLLGVMTERGMGTAPDRAAASALYRDAAVKGNRSAQARWGLALMQEIGRASCRERVSSPV